MITRRTFLSMAGLGVAALALPAISAPPQPRDEWQDFLDRLKVKVDALVAREGRGLSRYAKRLPLCIDAPRVSEDGTYFTRRVTVHLEAGGSLLLKTCFVWDEFYMTRWSGE